MYPFYCHRDVGRAKSLIWSDKKRPSRVCDSVPQFNSPCSDLPVKSGRHKKDLLQIRTGGRNRVLDVNDVIERHLNTHTHRNKVAGFPKPLV